MRKVLHLMGTLTDVDVEWLIAKGQTRLMPRGTLIIEQNHPIQALFVLLEGQLSVRLGGGNGQDVARLYPGEVLGEISFVDARPPSASVVAEQDSHVLAVPSDVLRSRLQQDDGFAARFYRGLAVFLADRLRSTTAHLGYGTWDEQQEADAIDEGSFDEISLAAQRFDTMLRRLRLMDGGA